MYNELDQDIMHVVFNKKILCLTEIVNLIRVK